MKIVNEKNNMKFALINTTQVTFYYEATGVKKTTL